MKTERLTTSESLMLDIVRVTASAVVAFGHLTQQYFSTGWRDCTDVARGAVAVFFILSGFVIRYVTAQRPETMQRYFVDRASRIYSVALPALCLTLVFDIISRTVNPAFYSSFAADASHPLLRILVNLVFLGQLWRDGINPLSNSPYWSICYEVAYYLAYGCFFYLVGKRRMLSLALVALLFGPRVIFLGLLWFVGCLVHDLYQKWNASHTAAKNLNYILLGISVLGSGLALLGAHNRLNVLSSTNLWTSLQQTLIDNHFIAAYMRTKRISNLNFAFGLIWAFLFLKLLQIARAKTIRPNSRLVRTVRFIAEGTFPIYLLHYPLYVLIAACIPYNHARSLPKLFIFLLVLGLGILAGHPANLLKSKLRLILLKHSFIKLRQA